MFKGTTITATCSSEFGCCKLNSVYDWYLNFWCLLVVSSPPPLSSHPTPWSPGHPTCALRSQSPLLVHISCLFEDPPMWTHAPLHNSTTAVLLLQFFSGFYYAFEFNYTTLIAITTTNQSEGNHLWQESKVRLLQTWHRWKNKTKHLSIPSSPFPPVQ